VPFSNEDGVLSSPVEVLGVLKAQDGVLSSPVEVLGVPVPFAMKMMCMQIRCTKSILYGSY